MPPPATATGHATDPVAALRNSIVESRVVAILSIDARKDGAAEDAASAARLAHEAGFPVEILLRTPHEAVPLDAAFKAITLATGYGVPVAAGTVTNLFLAEQAISAGASAIVMPGPTPDCQRIFDLCKKEKKLYVGGFGSFKEGEDQAQMMQGTPGFLKFFPGDAEDSTTWLKRITDPLPIKLQRLVATQIRITPEAKTEATWGAVYHHLTTHPDQVCELSLASVDERNAAANTIATVWRQPVVTTGGVNVKNMARFLSTRGISVVGVSVPPDPLKIGENLREIRVALPPKPGV